MKSNVVKLTLMLALAPATLNSVAQAQDPKTTFTVVRSDQWGAQNLNPFSPGSQHLLPTNSAIYETLFFVNSLNGKVTPVLDIRNNGLAHGRLGGFLTGTDAKNTALEFSPSNMPILPGETRAIPLTATRPGDPETPVQAQFPVVVTGKIEWGKGQIQTIEQRFAP